MKYLLIISILLTFFGCGVIFEPDLAQQTLVLQSPPDSFNTSNQTITFIWEEMDDATSYRIEVVSDSFEYITDYILDTTITDNSYSLFLDWGHYQWRVTGQNNATETSPQTRTLIIEEDTILSNQTVNIITPDDGAYYNSDSVAFLWSAISYADNYQLQVASNSSFNSQTIIIDINTDNDYYYMIDEAGTGTYYWRIQAKRNNTDSTGYTNTRTLSIDAIPVPLSPDNGTTLSSLPTTINWSTAGSTQQDSLYIYYENEQSPFITTANNSSTYQFSNTDTVGKGAGTYYWQVRSLSGNGNISSYSNLYSFTIN